MMVDILNSVTTGKGWASMPGLCNWLQILRFCDGETETAGRCTRQITKTHRYLAHPLRWCSNSL